MGKVINNKYKLAVSLNYQSLVIKSILFFLAIILPFVVMMVLVANHIIDKKSIRFEIILPAYLVFVAVATLLFLRKKHKIVEFHLKSESFEAESIGTIKYDEVSSCRIQRIKGYVSFIITLNDGKKMAIGPTKNFSDEADETFENFVLEFQELVNSDLKGE